MEEGRAVRVIWVRDEGGLLSVVGAVKQTDTAAFWKTQSTATPERRRPKEPSFPGHGDQAGCAHGHGHQTHASRSPMG